MAHAPLRLLLRQDVSSQTPLWSACTLRSLQALACASSELRDAVGEWLAGHPRMRVELKDATPQIGWCALRQCPALRTLELDGREFCVAQLRSAARLELSVSVEEALVLAPFVAQNGSLESLLLRDAGGCGAAAEHVHSWIAALGGRAARGGAAPAREVSLTETTLPRHSLVFAAALLRGNGAARSFRACDAAIDAHGVDVLVECLGRPCLLGTLNLSQNALGDSGCVRLTRALRALPSLRRLVLQAAAIGPRGGEALGALLAEPATALVELDLLGNLLGCGGATALARGLGRSSTLRTLNLRSNRVADAGAVELGGALGRNRSLRTLLLSWNRVGDVGAAALAAGLEANTSLRELNLLENYVGDSGACALRAGLQANCTLSCCSLQCNLVQGSIVAELEAWLASIHNDDPPADDADDGLTATADTAVGPEAHGGAASADTDGSDA